MSSPAEGVTAEADERAGRLRARLADAGIDVVVEADGNVALLHLSGDPSSLAPRRREVVATARAVGFTHVAVELPTADGPGGSLAHDADVHRAQPER